MAALRADQRQAAFVCVMALCRPDGTCRFFEGRLEGIILTEGRGSGGFGYDPLFLVPEYGMTLAELPMQIKNRISHRGQALRQLADSLRCFGAPLSA
jgi:XTP/dITP diphosphohydrolase